MTVETQDSAIVRVAVGQFAPDDQPDHNHTEMLRLARAARDRGAELIVFPEYSAWFRPPFGPEVREYAETLEGPFVQRVSATARELGLWIVFGMFESLGTDHVSNTVVAIDPSGRIQARYRKRHLYDAFGTRESDWIAPGDTSGPDELFRIGGLTFGLQTCYDLRFPESSRVLVDAGADVILVPSEWVPGRHKEHHWSTLTTARAIENTAYVVAADQSAPGGIGASVIVDPAGIALATLGAETGLALGDLDPAHIEAVRETNPALSLRRYRVLPRAGSPLPTKTD
ncbi:carbon-nitrogen hydrolase family protein [Mycetocola lacteus]|uniref:Carbon-nitrogen hydrolase family protein n=1 Tax=Mycetocola lacteus TaxID=76637 RepID=A0A3L7AKE2_9MICO|nr:carbon-nitrogen hydrolase family protein [Mycetocola lacteus]RLP80737.1 carbon-nitrogen hydrolase family protein [Mycetocola lacteus]RLP84522.1 carbon-nitrogen hydrolase family protein [Mycetocola lacteus]